MWASGAVAQGLSPDERKVPARGGFAPDHILVKAEGGASGGALKEANRRSGASSRGEVPGSDDVSVVELPAGLPVEEAIKRYEDVPGVEYAEPDFVMRESALFPNDPKFKSQYGLHNRGQTGGLSDADIDTPEAWSLNVGSRAAVIAVVDSGNYAQHTDLRDNIWRNPGEIAGNRIDDDRNGYVDDVNGWDFANNDKSVYDPDPVSGAGDEHGTHVAGTIAARGNNSLGVTGVNWQARIMPLKFLGPNGGYTSDAVEAINYAVASGVKISSNSWGGGGFSQALRDAIARADASGQLFVAAAGNGGADGVGDDNDATPHYPSSYDLPNVVSVAASDDKDALASFSNFGASSVDLAAPGVRILSTLPGNAYGSYSGTSMATPHVAGAAALIKSKDSTLDDAGIKTRLLQSVDKKSALSAKTASGGR